METLPIRLLTDEDAYLFGSLNVSLGKLARSGLPVAEGMVTIQGSSEPRVEISRFPYKKLKASGSAFYDPSLEDVLIDVKFGKPHPKDLKKIVDIVTLANKKLFMPYVYEWILDKEVKLIRILPYTPVLLVLEPVGVNVTHPKGVQSRQAKSAVKVFLDLSEGLTIEKEVDGIFIDSLKTRDSEELTFKLVESATTFSTSPVLLKLSEKLEPILEALDFARHKKGLNNIHIVIPGVRASGEFMRIKRELATPLWLELSVPENIINLEDYLMGDLDGVILNLDQLIAHLNGFDLEDRELSSYRKETGGLLKFLEDGIKLLHKSNIPFIAFGSISLYPEVLDFLVERGVYGIVVERYEAHSMVDYLHQVEKRMILRRSI